MRRLRFGSAFLQNGRMFDWNDLRAFLAVARDGSTLAASRALGVNQTTVARRLEALEHALGLKLFERGRAGSRLTEAGEVLRAEAERVERAAEGFATQAQAYRRGLAGSIRVTTNEIMANTMTPGLAEFRNLYPGIGIELMITDQVLDLAKGEADIAVRGAQALPDSDLIARRIGQVTWSLYCSRDYAARRGVPSAPEELRGHALIGGDASLDRMHGMRWMFAHAPDAEVPCRSSTMTNMILAAKTGLGIAPLPCLTADVEEDLIQCFPPPRELTSTTWIVTRPDLKDVPRVRAFIDFIGPYFHKASHALIDRAKTLRDGEPPLPLAGEELSR